MARTVTDFSKSSSPGGSTDMIDAADLAQYISDMSGEMAALSRRAGWPLVTYFLEMAQIQAQERVRQRVPVPLVPPVGQRRRNGPR